MTDLKETLGGIVRAIVDHPDDVTILETQDGKEVNLVLNVAEEDMGMVIGRGGNIAKAIRSVMKAIAASEGKRVNVEIR